MLRSMLAIETLCTRGRVLGRDQRLLHARASVARDLYFVDRQGKSSQGSNLSPSRFDGGIFGDSSISIQEKLRFVARTSVAPHKA